MTQKKILVIDDEQMLVDLLKMRLEANGYDVETAFDGEEGLAKARRTRPDLIVLDIGMPIMDGYEVLKALRADALTKKTLVMMLTASGKKREIFEAQGISDYILKPFDTQDFLTRVDNVLEAKDAGP